MTIAIIGAGMAGLACAAKLKESGRDVRVFDKGRGPGGRMSTRRMQTPLGEISWDHGAQFFTARSDAFKKTVSDWIESDAAAIWNGKFLELGSNDPSTPAKDARYVGTPGMNGVIKHLAQQVDVQWSRRALSLNVSSAGWSIEFEDGPEENNFDSIVVAIPAEQASVLLQNPAPLFAEEASNVISAPCWAVLLAYDAPLQAGFDAAKISNGPLSWIARNSSKPGRSDIEAWVLHASPEWSLAHLEEQKDEIAAKLVRNFRAMSDAPAPVFAAAHRWRYAMIEQGVASPYRWNANLKLGTCGDWRIAPRVEAAWTSGDALAREIQNSA